MATTIKGADLTADQLMPLAARFRSKISPVHLANIADRGLFHRAVHVNGNLVVRGGLELDKAKVQVLFVAGDLTVEGRLEDRDDEEIESLIFVGGDLEADDLITFGTLEVHGDVVVRDHLVFLDNACAAHIEGDVTARLILDEYHHVHVGGQVRAPVVVQDSRGRIACKKKYKSCEFDSEAADVLVRDVLDGCKDEDEPGGFYVDNVDIRKAVARIRRGKPVLRDRAAKRK